MKRALDILVSLAALVVFALPMLVVALCVRVTSGSPVLFRQERPGRNGRSFVLLKFRTMRDAVDAHGRDLPDALRLTSFGRFLRRASLDELPQFWNVLVGEMSLVGPRPLLMEYLERYTPRQARRHEAKPGMTGWAQIRGRNAISWEERFELDVWYVEHVSFLLDLRIIGETFRVAVAQRGISAAGHATMPEFTGSRDEDSAKMKDTGRGKER